MSKEIEEKDLLSAIRFIAASIGTICTSSLILEIFTGTYIIHFMLAIPVIPACVFFTWIISKIINKH